MKRSAALSLVCVFLFTLGGCFADIADHLTGSAEQASLDTDPSPEAVEEYSLSETCHEPENAANTVSFISDEAIQWTVDKINAVIQLCDCDIGSLPDEIADLCIEGLNEDGFGCSELYAVRTAVWDMDSDGTEDIFVLPFPAGNARNILPPLYLFLSDSGSYKRVSIPLKTDTSVEILDSVTNGCYDLLWDCFGNVLSYEGADVYTGCEDKYSNVIFYPVTEEDGLICLKAGIPYGKPEYDNYILKMNIFDPDTGASYIAVSNDRSLNAAVYSEPPPNGIYYFYIDHADIGGDISKMLMEFRYVEAVCG